MTTAISPVQLVLNYIIAFNARDERAMRSSFSPSLKRERKNKKKKHSKTINE